MVVWKLDPEPTESPTQWLAPSPPPRTDEPMTIPPETLASLATDAIYLRAADATRNHDDPPHRGQEAILDHIPGIIQLGYPHYDHIAQPARLRIGPKTHKSNYTKVGDCLYKCERPSDFGQEEGVFSEVLWLRRSENGGMSWWDAYNAPASDDAPQVTRPIFWTFENALEEGWHHWKLAYPGKGHNSGDDFQTTVLQN